MPRQKCIDVYQFDELSDRAKERARDKTRQFEAETFTAEWDDTIAIADILGIAFDHHGEQLMSGKTVQKPSIYYSGFSSQGDGASFAGSYQWKDNCIAAIKEYAPQDERLHRIAQDLTDAQRNYGFRLKATISRDRGTNYCHEHTVTIDVEMIEADGVVSTAMILDKKTKAILVMQAFEGLPDIIDKDDATALAEALRDFMRWIYQQLEADYEYRQSDEQIDDTIRANEWEYDEDGDMA